MKRTRPFPDLPGRVRCCAGVCLAGRPPPAPVERAHWRWAAAPRAHPLPTTGTTNRPTPVRVVPVLRAPAVAPRPARPPARRTGAAPLPAASVSMLPLPPFRSRGERLSDRLLVTRGRTPLLDSPLNLSRGVTGLDFRPTSPRTRFHVKHRGHRADGAGLRLSLDRRTYRCHAPCHPCQLRMGRHRQRPRTSRFRVVAYGPVRNGRGPQGRRPTPGPHYRRAASLRPMGRRDHG